MAERFDGFFNAFIGHGMHGRDPFSNYIYTPSRMMTDWECADMFTYNGIAQKIITAPADEAVKEGFTLKDGEAEMEEQTKAVLSVMEDLEWEQRFSEALSWDRLYGGSAVLMMADDGTAELSEPLNESALRSIERLVVIEAPDITTSDAMLYSDPRSQLYGRPEFYNVTGYASPCTKAACSCFVVVYSQESSGGSGQTGARRSTKKCSMTSCGMTAPYRWP